MVQLLVRHLDDDVKAKLQRRAHRHGHSTEEEVRGILRNAVRDEGGTRVPLGSRPASSALVSRRTFPSCATNRPSRPTSSPDRTKGPRAPCLCLSRHTDALFGAASASQSVFPS